MRTGKALDAFLFDDFVDATASTAVGIDKLTKVLRQEIGEIERARLGV